MKVHIESKLFCSKHTHIGRPQHQVRGVVIVGDQNMAQLTISLKFFESDFSYQTASSVVVVRLITSSHGSYSIFRWNLIIIFTKFMGTSRFLLSRLAVTDKNWIWVNQWLWIAMTRHYLSWFAWCKRFHDNQCDESRRIINRCDSPWIE